MSTLRPAVIALVVLPVAIGVASGVTVAATPAPADATPAATPANAPNASTATLVAAYPNPVADGDPGEFVAIRFETPTNVSGWTLTDGETTAEFPDRTLEGTVAVSIRPADARAHTPHPVVPLSGRLRLADGGDRLELRAGDRTVSSARYRNAPESERRDFVAGTWSPIGSTGYEPVRADADDARVFVLPDAPNAVLKGIRAADERVLLGGYTFSSERIEAALLEAAADGVDVRVLLDGAPVGGVSDRQARTLGRLADGGVDVRLLSGPHTRYRHHHPKYVVADDRAIVSTENFKPAGTGGMSSRGWGVTLENDRIADALGALHRDDRTWRAATPWEEYRQGRTFAEADPALGEYDTEYEPDRVAIDAASLLVAPDNAAAALVGRIDAADDRILVQQVRIGSRDNRLLRAVLEAASRGVRVRIHLGGSWYVREDNDALAAWLNGRASEAGWDLEARVDEADNYEKIHTKGVIVDDTAVVGSLNWDASAQSNNREVLVALEGPEAAAYYATVFEGDWDSGDGNDRPLPAGILAAAAAATAAALLLVRRIGFVGRNGVLTDWRWRSLLAEERAPQFLVEFGRFHLLDERLEDRLARAGDELDRSDDQVAAARDARAAEFVL